MIVPCDGRPLERDLVDTRLPTTTVTLASCLAPRISSGMESFPRGDAYGTQIPGDPSHWFAVFQDRRRPTIGMPTHSQHPRGDRPRRHKGVDVSQSRCILVSSRKHHRSVLWYRPDRGRNHVVGAEPSGGWRDAFGNRGGGGWGWARRRGPLRRFSRSRSRRRPDRGLAALPACLEFLAMSGMDVGGDSLSPISTRYEDHSRSAVSRPASGSRWTIDRRSEDRRLLIAPQPT